MREIIFRGIKREKMFTVVRSTFYSETNIIFPYVNSLLSLSPVSLITRESIIKASPGAYVTVRSAYIRVACCIRDNANIKRHKAMKRRGSDSKDLREIRRGSTIKAFIGRLFIHVYHALSVLHSVRVFCTGILKIVVPIER